MNSNGPEDASSLPDTADSSVRSELWYMVNIISKKMFTKLRKPKRQYWGAEDAKTE